MQIKDLLPALHAADPRALARCITIVENELEGNQEILQHLQIRSEVPVIGLTGPPGAGKSSLVDALVSALLLQGKRIGVIAVDPSSPFHFGALLGDRIRLATHFLHDRVFIRSMATRGSLGGLSDKIMEVTDVMRSAGFDYIFIETVGVGQSEVEIAGLADTTIVVLVPESGDEVQGMKSGLMEIANIFVVNKSDRDEAHAFARQLRHMVLERFPEAGQPPVLQTTATRQEGVAELLQSIHTHHQQLQDSPRRFRLLTEKALRLIARQRIRDIDPAQLLEKVSIESGRAGFNIYSFIRQYE